MATATEGRYRKRSAVAAPIRTTRLEVGSSVIPKNPAAPEQQAVAAEAEDHDCQDRRDDNERQPCSPIRLHRDGHLVVGVIEREVRGPDERFEGSCRRS